MRLENEVAIVTGVGAGIGRACATLFAKEGAYTAAKGAVASLTRSMAVEYAPHKIRVRMPSRRPRPARNAS